jgi:hypothetical protein
MPADGAAGIVSALSLLKVFSIKTVLRKLGVLLGVPLVGPIMRTLCPSSSLPAVV